jgi:hypothetical protein
MIKHSARYLMFFRVGTTFLSYHLKLFRDTLRTLLTLLASAPVKYFPSQPPETNSKKATFNLHLKNSEWKNLTSNTSFGLVEYPKINFSGKITHPNLLKICDTAQCRVPYVFQGWNHLFELSFEVV